MRAQLPILYSLTALLAAASISCKTAGDGGGAAGAEGTGGGEAAQPARLEVRYDERNDTTLYRVVPPTVASGVHLVAGAVIEGRQPKQPPEQVLLGFRWTGPEPRFEKCQQARWRADGSLVAEVDVTRDAQLGGGITEFLSGTVSYPRAQALAAASSVSVQACGVDLDIPGDELSLLRDLVRRVSGR